MSQHKKDLSLYNSNPLSRIQVGTPDEIRQVREFAKAVVKPMGYRTTWETIVVQCISVSALHLLYCAFVHGMDFPTVEDVRNFLMCNFVEEDREDEDGNPIFDEETGDIDTCIHVKAFPDTLEKYIEFEHVPYGDIQIRYWEDNLVNEGKGGFATRLFTSEMLHELYPVEDIIHDINPHIHPWIYRNFIQLCNDNNTLTAASLATAALEEYIDSHSKCRLFEIQKEMARINDDADAGAQFTFQPDSEDTENLFAEGQENPFADVLDKKQKYGRRLKNPFRSIAKALGKTDE